MGFFISVIYVVKVPTGINSFPSISNYLLKFILFITELLISKLFHEISIKESKNISYFLEHREKENYHIEDVFWSLYVPKKHSFQKPDYKTAMRFCVDRKPEVAFGYLNGELPFACHGFNKKGVVKFWSKYIS